MRVGVPLAPASPAGCAVLLTRAVGCVLSVSSDWRAATMLVSWVLLTRAVGCVLRAACNSLAVTKPGGSEGAAISSAKSLLAVGSMACCRLRLASSIGSTLPQSSCDARAETAIVNLQSWGVKSVSLNG